MAGVTYDLILADPPWRYDFSRSDSRRVERHYGTMSAGDLAALNVQAIAAEDATLWLWATAPKLPLALDTMRAWGFTYRTGAIWHKIGGPPGMGHYNRVDHEHLLIGTRGSPGTPPPDVRETSVLRAPAGEHSEKPIEIHGRLERYYPDARRVELFARRARQGWHAWGDQLFTATEEGARARIAIARALGR